MGWKPSTVKIKGNNNKLVIFYGISLFLGINTHKNRQNWLLLASKGKEMRFVQASS